MKAFSFIVLLVVLSIISTLNYYTSNDPGSSIENTVNNTFPSIDKSGIRSAVGSTIYKVTAKLDNFEKRINVSSSIYVFPEDPAGADTIFFFLGVIDVAANTGLINSTRQKLNSFSNFDIGNFQINGITKELNFYDTGNGGIADSVIGYINLNDVNHDRDTIVISLDYNININSESSTLGYATGREFYYV